MSGPTSSLLVISDRKLLRRPLPEVAKNLANAGCPWLMIREKDLENRQLAVLVRDVRAAIGSSTMRLSINGDHTIAEADPSIGLHLAQACDPTKARERLGPDRLIGQSAHDEEEISRAAEQGADYVTLSPVFRSTSKGDYAEPLGLAKLRELALRSPIPVIALGGVTDQNAASCLEAGAKGIAVLGAIMAARDPGAAVSAFLSRIRQTD